MERESMEVNPEPKNKKGSGTEYSMGLGEEGRKIFPGEAMVFLFYFILFESFYVSKFKFVEYVIYARIVITQFET